jgi:threonyl-tRNA synthetase
VLYAPLVKHLSLTWGAFFNINFINLRSRVKMVNFKEDENLKTLNHSCAHLMAQAVKHLYPDAKFWVGPVVAEGFYYDIDLGDRVIRDEDIAAIEKEMKKVAKTGKKIIRREISKQEAMELFKDDEYKIDLISKLEDGTITCYDQGDFTDLCRGPHVDNVKLCRNFKLIKHSGVYWKGDSKNKVLQRIYGVCFPTAEELEAHLALLEEAKERDHRKIGKDMQLFMSDDLIGRGLPMFLPKGYVIWQELENYIKEKERKNGYLHVMTPCIGTVNLYKTSGHWDHYKENMFPAMEVEGESFVLRPMNCPHHMMIYANRMHSYKDLPIRIGEIAHDFRFEASGTLKGIERGRHFCQNDAHLFVAPEQIEDEFKKVVDLIFSTYKDFGITDYRCVLSLRDPEDKVKYHDDDEMWNNAENALRRVLDDIGIEYTEEIGEAAFYGPKLDVNVKPAIGNEYTLSTCQLDFCLPAKFNLSYIDKDGEKKTPVVLHRAILGSLDRFMAYILEETKGNLPLWLAPVQARVMPVTTDNEELVAYAQKVCDALEAENVRVELDARAEKLGYRMREGQVQKVPYLLVIGNNEKEENTVSYRLHGEQKTTTVSLDEFVEKVKTQIATKALEIN